jgi:hypothetical protein
LDIPPVGKEESRGRFPVQWLETYTRQHYGFSSLLGHGPLPAVFYRSPFGKKTILSTVETNSKSHIIIAPSSLNGCYRLLNHIEHNIKIGRGQIYYSF